MGGVKFARDDYVAFVIEDATQTNAKHLEVQRGPQRSVVRAVVVVAVEGAVYPQRSGQVIYRAPAVWMTAGGFVSDQDVRSLVCQTLDDIGIDGPPMPANRTRAPPILARGVPRMSLSAVMDRRSRRNPDRRPEDPADTRKSGSVWQGDDTAVNVAIGEFAVEHIFEGGLRSGVVVAMDEPQPISDGVELDVQWSHRLEVTEQDHCHGLQTLRNLQDVIKAPVRIAAKQDCPPLRHGKGARVAATRGSA